jgi:plasmid replication initiation protein
LYSSWHKSAPACSQLCYFLGLGVCALAEFGRFLIYNILVDGGRGEEMEDTDDSDSEDQEVEFRGYKQMLLVLQSTEVETGKSFFIRNSHPTFSWQENGYIEHNIVQQCKNFVG